MIEPPCFTYAQRYRILISLEEISNSILKNIRMVHKQYYSNDVVRRPRSGNVYFSIYWAVTRINTYEESKKNYLKLCMELINILKCTFVRDSVH